MTEKSLPPINDQIDQNFIRIFDRLDALESRMNKADLSIDDINGLLGKIENGILSMKTVNQSAVESIESKIKTISEELALRKEVDKSHDGQISGLEAFLGTLDRKVELMLDRMDGGLEKTWTIEQIRSAIRNQAFTGNLLKGAVSIFGVGSIVAVVSAVFGFGIDEQEFTYLDTFIQHEDRYELFELEVKNELTKLNVVYDSLSITVDPPSD